MADILIRGIAKMPGNCRECMFAGFGGMRNELNVCMFSGESQSLISHERMSKCPLLHLPEGHGRLGDLDELHERIALWIRRYKRAFTDDQHVWLTAILRGIEESPTIVPAEGRTKE